MKALILFALLPLTALADTGLAMRCDGGITAPTQAAACTGSRTWVHPAPSDAVLSYPAVVPNSTAIVWNDANLQFRPWIAIPGTYGVLTCTKDLAAANVAIPVGGPDQCAPGADAVAKVFVAASTVAVAVVVPPVALTNGMAHLTWTAPTININDGSPLTDLKSYNLYQGVSPTALVKLPGSLPATAPSYIVSGLASGTYYFGVTAVDSAGNESDPGISNAVSVAKQTTPKKPGAPGSVTVTVTVSVP